jgi:hypothetical protein
LPRHRATLTVALAAGLLTLLAATPLAAADHVRRTEGGGRSISVRTSSPERAFLDGGTPDVSIGDVRVVSASLFDARGRKVGDQELSCTVTDPADESTGRQATLCTRVVRLSALGELVAVGTILYQNVSITEGAPSLLGTQAVVGGTGAFRGARGELRYRTEGNSVRLVFRLLPQRR